MFFNRRKKAEKSIEISNFINDYKDFLLREKIFKSESDITYFFTMGGCFIFARILMSEFPEVKLLINKDRTHCKVRYYDKNYDIRGFRYKELDDFFRIATKKDIKYMNEHFGFTSYTLKGNEPCSKDAFDNNFIHETTNFYHTGEKPRTISEITITNRKW